MSLRDEILAYIDANYGLSGKVLYVSQKSGNDSNNGSTEALAFKTINAALTAANTGGFFYKINVLGGEYDEHLRLYDNVIIGQGDVKLTCSTNDTIQLRNFDVTGAVIGCTIDNDSYYAINKGNGASGYNQYFLGIIDCKVTGGCFWARGGKTILADSEFHDCAFEYGSNGGVSAVALSSMENITFYNVTDVSFSSFLSVVGKQNPSKIILYNSSLTVYDNSDNYDNMLNCVLYNSSIRFTDEAVIWSSISSSFAAVTSASEIRAKRDLDLSATTDSDWYETCGFIDPDFLDADNLNFFPSNTDLYQYNSGRHIGAYREAIYIDSTSMTAPPNGSVASGYAESTSAPGTGIEFVCDAIEFSRAKKIKRIHVLIDIGTGGEIMSSQTEDANRRSIDVDMCFSATKTAAELDAAPETYSNYALGITDVSTLEYGGDVDEIAKSVKFKFTLKNEGSSTDFGEVKVYQIIPETEDVKHFENLVEYEVPQPSTKLYTFADTTEEDELSACELNINPFNDVVVAAKVQAVIDDGLTALTLPTGQKVFTVQELIALAGATFTGNYNIDINYLDANTVSGIVYTYADGTMQTLGTIEPV